MKRLTAPILLLAITVLAGCGGDGHQEVQLLYTGTAAQPAVANGPKKLYLLPFTDQRAEKAFIGDINNIQGARLLDIVLVNEPTQVVTDAVRQELEKAGYRVVMATADDQPTDAPSVEGSLIDIYCCEPSLTEGSIAKLSFEASVVDGGTERLGGIYAGQGSRWSLTGYGAGAYQEAMSEALQTAVEQLIADVNQQAP